MKLFGLHINAVNGQCKCSPFRLQCLLFALTSVFWSVWAFHHVLFICMFCSRCSLFSLFFSKRRNSSLKEEKHVRAQGNPQTSLLLLLYLIHSLSILYIHCFCFPLLLSSCACVRGGVLPLRGFLCFWPIVPPPFLLLLLDGSLKFTDCTQILLADFNLCISSLSFCFPPNPLTRTFFINRVQPVELSVLPLPGCLVSLSVSHCRYFRPKDLLSEGELLLGHEAGAQSSHAVHILKQKTFEKPSFWFIDT